MFLENIFFLNKNTSTFHVLILEVVYSFYWNAPELDKENTLSSE